MESQATTAEVLKIPEETRTGDVGEFDTALVADIIAVDIFGGENQFQISVRISSPDTGCEQYADWWEVLTPDGKLLYRRILTHSHVDEQPFTRSGGPVEILEDTVVIVRAHMHPSGFGGTAYQGTVRDGYKQIQLPANFVDGLELVPPQPSGCAF